MKFNFSFGKKKPKTTTLIIVGILISTIITALSIYFRVSEEKIWDIVDEVQRKLPHTTIRDIILSDPNKIERRVIRDVDKAIADYERLTGDDGRATILPPRYTEEPIDTSVCYTKECQSLGGAMRITAPWHDLSQ
jgi:hypothetical protein